MYQLTFQSLFSNRHHIFAKSRAICLATIFALGVKLRARQNSEKATHVSLPLSCEHADCGRNSQPDRSRNKVTDLTP